MIEFEKLADVLCFTIGGKLTDEDYKTTLKPEIEKALQTLTEMGKLKRLKIAVIVDESFVGHTLHAMLDDIIYGFKHRKDFHKIGITGNFYKQDDKIVKIGTKLIAGKMKIFETQEEMFEWLK